MRVNGGYMQFQNQHGITLLEMILVLAIAASLMTLGVRVYNQFQFQANEQKIMGNVNQLFLALEGFYFANCRQALDVNSNPQSPGRLDPAVIDGSGIKENIILDVNTDIITPQFIPAANWQPNNPLLDNTPSNQGYNIQFNRVLVNNSDPSMSVYACTGATPPAYCDATNGAVLSATDNPPSAQSHAVTWVVQVAVKLSDNLTSAQWVQIQNDLSATCISSASGSGVAACTTSPSAGGYLVWTRTPSYFSQHISSDYWTATPYVKEFNMQYTNDGMATLSGVTNETQNWYNPLNYLCGG